jgi:hypothetical protein
MSSLQFSTAQPTTWHNQKAYLFISPAAVETLLSYLMRVTKLESIVSNVFTMNQILAEELPRLNLRETTMLEINQKLEPHKRQFTAKEKEFWHNYHRDKISHIFNYRLSKPDSYGRLRMRVCEQLDNYQARIEQLEESLRQIYDANCRLRLQLERVSVAQIKEQPLLDPTTPLELEISSPDPLPQNSTAAAASLLSQGNGFDSTPVSQPATGMPPPIACDAAPETEPPRALHPSDSIAISPPAAMPSVAVSTSLPQTAIFGEEEDFHWVAPSTDATSQVEFTQNTAPTVLQQASSVLRMVGSLFVSSWAEK